MKFKKGNTYTLDVEISNINIEDISKIVFKFGDIEKEYNSEEQGEVIYVDNKFIVSFSQEETLNFKKEVQIEVAIKFIDNSVKRSPIYSVYSLDTIIEEVI